jgi:F-type H+-transporting ATPase subunit b
MRRCLLIGLMLAVLAAATSAWLPAADPHDGHGSKEPITPRGVEKGLFLGSLDLAIWTIVVFLLLLWVLRKYAWGPILEGLRHREEGFARDKREAEHARREAAEARARAEAETARVNSEIGQMMAKARQDAEALVRDEQARGKAEIQAERDRLRRELSMERDQALQEVWSKSVSLATLISSKAIGKHLSDADHRALLDEALAEFRAAGQSRVQDIESARA